MSSIAWEGFIVNFLGVQFEPRASHAGKIMIFELSPRYNPEVIYAYKPVGLSERLASSYPKWICLEQPHTIAQISQNNSMEIDEYDVPLFTLAGKELRDGCFGIMKFADLFLGQLAKNCALILVEANYCPSLTHERLKIYMAFIVLEIIDTLD
jgi:hypothetical protein